MHAGRLPGALKKRGRNTTLACQHLVECKGECSISSGHTSGTKDFWVAPAKEREQQAAEVSKSQ